MRFTKMHGLGNDYVYLNCTERVPRDLSALAVKLSDRHYGVGSDGLICIFPSQAADFRMEMYNADGSPGEMCGNGIRCVGKYVYDKGLTTGTVLEIETPAGIRRLELHVHGGRVESVSADMGEPIIHPCRSISVKDKCYTVKPVSMGNPHAVLYVDDLDDLDLQALGPGFECHPAFPGRTNTEFASVLDRGIVRMRVWERGSGETLACGTGACAVLAASADLGLTDRTAVVRLRGGDLSVCWADDNHIYLTGPAVTVFEGEISDGENK